MGGFVYGYDSGVMGGLLVRCILALRLCGNEWAITDTLTTGHIILQEVRVVA